ncbi:hypothetical protein FIV04_25445 (plasmid) [Vibrio sp. THAF190c]|jgi:ssDNA-binding Zn-finger/Zn-ribbon topoisomerase 1|nr:hypothetical protein FIV04_25445 [Vibrio sp. THAF190c]
MTFLLPLSSDVKFATEVNQTDEINDVYHGENCPKCNGKETYKRYTDGKAFIVCDSCTSVFIPVNSKLAKSQNQVILENCKLHYLH